MPTIFIDSARKTYKLNEVNNLKVMPSGVYINKVAQNLNGVTRLPDNLDIGPDLNLEGSGIKELPKGLKVGGRLSLTGSDITALPDDLQVTDLNLRESKVTELNPNITVSNWISADSNIRLTGQISCTKFTYDVLEESGDTIDLSYIKAETIQLNTSQSVNILNSKAKSCCIYLSNSPSPVEIKLQNIQCDDLTIVSGGLNYFTSPLTSIYLDASVESDSLVLYTSRIRNLQMHLDNAKINKIENDYSEVTKATFLTFKSPNRLSFNGRFDLAFPDYGLACGSLAFEKEQTITIPNGFCCLGDITYT